MRRRTGWPRSGTGSRWSGPRSRRSRRSSRQGSSGPCRASSSISASVRRSWIRPTAASRSAATAHSTCGWIQTSGLTAADLVNALPEDALAALFRENGEGRLAGRIARAVVAGPAVHLDRCSWPTWSPRPSRRRPAEGVTRPAACSRRCASRSTTSSASCATALPVALDAPLRRRRLRGHQLPLGGRPADQAALRRRSLRRVRLPARPALRLRGRRRSIDWCSAAPASRRRPRSPPIPGLRAPGSGPSSGRKPPDGSALAATAPARRHASGSPSRRWGRGAADGAGAPTPAIRQAPLRVVPPRPRRVARSRRIAMESGAALMRSSVASSSGRSSPWSWARRSSPTARSGCRRSSTSSHWSRPPTDRASCRWLGSRPPLAIVGAPPSQLHMVHPASVTELPYVPLTVPLPTPTVTRRRHTLHPRRRPPTDTAPSAGTAAPRAPPPP